MIEDHRRDGYRKRAVTGSARCGDVRVQRASTRVPFASKHRALGERVELTYAVPHPILADPSCERARWSAF
jgi:hypothetical protein